MLTFGRPVRRGFRVRVALVLGLALALAASGRSFTAAAPVEIAFELSGNHVFVPVRAGDQDLWFVLDTGAGTSLLDLSRARAMHLGLGQAFSARGGGPASTPGARLAQPATVTVGSGPTAVAVPVAAALDFSSLAAYAGRDFDGILGGDFIRRFVVEIDFAQQRLRLHAPDEFRPGGRGATLPLTFRNGFPHVRATLRISDAASFDVDGMLDVGSALPLVISKPVVASERLADRLTASVPVPFGFGAGGSSEGRVGRLAALELGSLLVTKPTAVLAGDNSGVFSSSALFDVNIGSGLMRHYTVTFDYGRSQVTFEPNATAGEPFEYDMSGLVISTDGPPYAVKIVRSVVAGLPGAVAGLAPGDRLKTIDGRSSDGMTLDAIRRLFREAGRTFRIVVDRGGHDVAVSLTTKRLA